MLTRITRQSGAQIVVSRTVNDDRRTSHGRLNRLVFLLAGILLSATSISVAALAGWNRGASTPESVIWAGAGIGLSLAALAAPSMLVMARGWRRAATASIYALSLAFVIVAALGSQHAGREVASSSERATAGEREKLEVAYRHARDALTALPATRPARVIEAELDAILRDPRLHGCEGWLASVKLRTVCIEKVEPARAELANARERERLQGTMTEAMEVLGAIRPGKPASADALALGRYLSLLGIEPGADRIADAINLLVVLATEIGGGLALMLARQNPTPPESTPSDDIGDGGSRIEPQPIPKLPPPESAASRRQKVIDRLRSGALEGRQSDIAESVGVPITTLRRMVEADPALRLRALPGGVSRLEFVDL